MSTRTSHSQTEAQLGNAGVRDFAELNLDDDDRVRGVASGATTPPAREEFTPPRFEDERPELNPDRKFGSTESGWEQGARTQSKKKRAAPKKRSKS